MAAVGPVPTRWILRANAKLLYGCAVARHRQADINHKILFGGSDSATKLHPVDVGRRGRPDTSAGRNHGPDGTLELGQRCCQPEDLARFSLAHPDLAAG